ncbi:hypothetical protein [Amnibacterium endophyticum]|uniref:Uncharacterized protein n=1 Tax=Amnibacterium endophyticum TaxID=2109337 RepID=A0ABW4LF32_9MICO
MAPPPTAPRGPGGTASDELDRAVATYVGHGFQVVFLSPRRAVLERRQRVHVLLNVALTLVTGGIWLLFLAIRLLNWPKDRVVLTLDDHGVLVPEFSS